MFMLTFRVSSRIGNHHSRPRGTLALSDLLAICYPTRCILETLTNSEDPDEMQRNAAFHHGLHRLLILKQSPGTEIHHSFEKSIRIQRANHTRLLTALVTPI